MVCDFGAFCGSQRQSCHELKTLGLSATERCPELFQIFYYK